MVVPRVCPDGRRRYGQTIMDRAGRPEDPERCVEAVPSDNRAPTFFQCARKRGHGEDGLYCRQHALRHPDLSAPAQLAWGVDEGDSAPPRLVFVRILRDGPTVHLQRPLPNAPLRFMYRCAVPRELVDYTPDAAWRRYAVQLRARLARARRDVRICERNARAIPKRLGLPKTRRRQ